MQSNSVLNLEKCHRNVWNASDCFWTILHESSISYWGNERGCDEGHWPAHTRGLPWGLTEVVGTVEQVHCSQKRLLKRGLEFHACTLNKSAHTKNVWKLIVCTSYIYISPSFLLSHYFVVYIIWLVGWLVCVYGRLILVCHLMLRDRVVFVALWLLCWTLTL